MDECTWWERVSALLDGELDPVERVVVEHHLDQCLACTAMSQSLPTAASDGVVDPDRLTSTERRWLHGDATRVLLLLAALALLCLAIPAYVQGYGNSVGDHTQRHLAMWQIGIAIGLLVACVASRFSHAMLAVAASFLLLTGIAAAYDFVAGHPGPWSEPVHLVELISAVLLWRLTPPHLLPWRTRSEEPA